MRRRDLENRRSAYYLFHDLRGGVQVNETFVNFKLITIPGLGTLAARLYGQVGSGGVLRSGMIRTDLRVVIFKTFVGSLTGPLTRRFLSFALCIRSVETAGRMNASITEEGSDK